MQDKERKIIKCKLSSGLLKMFNINDVFLLGRVSNKNKNLILKKKYTYKWRNTKSIVRGVAMNPVDHPHGGNTKTNKPEVSKWGWIAKHSK